MWTCSSTSQDQARPTSQYPMSWKVDEGNDQFSFEGRYQQSGPNVTITIVNHGLLPDKRVAIDFTSGDLLDGQYTVSSVPDEMFILDYVLMLISWM